MEKSFPGGKHHSDGTTADLPESTSTEVSSSKRRLPSYPHPPWKLLPSETLFRMLCPGDFTGGVIGKGGSIIRKIREETGARIRIDEAVPGTDDRAIVIIGDMTAEKEVEGVAVSPAQRALVRVFERMRKVEAEKGGEEDGQWQVVCRLLAFGTQVGCVLGKGGRIVEKIRQDSGAQIRVLAGELVPACAAATGDELIIISGSSVAVNKAILAVSSCLQDNHKNDAATVASIKSFLANTHGSVPSADRYGQWSVAPALHTQDYHSSQRRIFEEEVVFRILCPNEKVRNVIGKGGVIIKALQGETGATIKIINYGSESDERIIAISAYENPEIRHSPTQDAILRVHSRLIDAGSEKGSTSARLLVPSQQIGCLLGRGGNIIADMRKSTGANIQIFLKEHLPKCAQPNDEVVQVTGSFQSVQDALLHITGRIREAIFPLKLHPSSAPYLPTSADIHHSALLRTRNMSDPPIAECYGPATSDRVSNLYGGDIPGHGPPYDHSSSPRTWASRGGSSCNLRSISEPRKSMCFNGVPSAASAESGSHLGLGTATVEVVIPQQYLGFVYGENSSNLADIKEISGAKVTVHDPKPGVGEGLVIISGSSDQIRTAQSLLHAFILCGITAA